MASARPSGGTALLLLLLLLLVDADIDAMAQRDVTADTKCNCDDFKFANNTVECRRRANIGYSHSGLCLNGEERVGADACPQCTPVRNDALLSPRTPLTVHSGLDCVFAKCM